VSLQKEDHERRDGKSVLAPHEGYVSLLFLEEEKLTWAAESFGH
jgi:hypothetical protein